MARTKTIDYQPIEEGNFIMSYPSVRKAFNDVSGKLFRAVPPADRVGTVEIEGMEEDIEYHVTRIFSAAARRLRNEGKPWQYKRFSFPDDWDWRWTTRSGNMSKRIQKLLVKEYNVPRAVFDGTNYLSDLCSILAEHTYPAEMLFDITNDLEWNAGDFSDRGSCFWGDRYGARLAMQNNNYFAFRMWLRDENTPNKYRSWKRAWLVPDFPRKYCFTLFNFYGNSRSLAYNLLSGFFGMNYCGCELCNFGDTTDVLYINGETGHVFYPADNSDFASVRNYDRLDLELECLWDSDDCYEEDDEYYDEDGDN